ncbi:ATP-binding protein [Bacillus sp. F19]|nr:ATP-binding protein [Bacillus sp. F19]
MQIEKKATFSHYTLEEKKKALKNIKILHPRFNHALGLIRKCHDSIHTSETPLSGLITGLSGSGKTTVIKTYLQKYGQVVSGETQTKKTILHAEVVSPATINTFMETLLEKLGDPFPVKGTIGNKNHRLENLIQKCGIEIIILDEVQHFVQTDDHLRINKVSDCFKSLVNRTNVPCVLFGMAESKQVLKASSQLNRRFSIRYDLTTFAYDTEDSVKEFRTLLHLIDSQLPFVEMAGLGDMAERFYYATNGLMDSIIKIVREAAENAIKDQKDKIDLKDLAKGFQLQAHLLEEGKMNPFAQKEFSIHRTTKVSV